ncbi:hypothetical protein H6F88_20600 [Oculatella sp. FACHB-28]|uniref:hypothetical protein n=1 Tax=Cyanophyceae TaxID=3028117 RepID=UPI001688FDB6|nr:hypothetical protein [Cyanobacteria bacterium FACHB-471]MBD2058363.1 hypothetical protein [Oculatella sp. FACHB-28]MBD2067432.1 hypothetical protein [Leptolyngbya sp. FACHB-671]
MAHTFLMEAGRWTLQGNWLDRDGLPVSVKGKILVAWSRDNWYTMVTKLMFPGTEREEIAFQYRGRLNVGERQYTFVLQHSLLGRVEGEGWIAPESIVQRYWVLGDRQRRTGFEALHQLDDNKYRLSSSVMAGHYLTSTMEASVERQLDE